MKKLALSILLLVGGVTFAQTPSVQDLTFFTGKWEIMFEIYDTHNPGNRPIFVEKGYQITKFDLNYQGTPMFLITKGYIEIVETDEEHTHLLGRKREFQESIRYGKFENSFERIGLYSNWPATGIEILNYNAKSKLFVIRGQLNVQRNMLERYVDTYQFNENYTSYERTNIANFSDMPFTEYNLTLRGTGKKVSD